LIFLLLGVVPTFIGKQVHGESFLYKAGNEYYPGTILKLEVTNLTVQEQYSILIGANQFVEDQQWYNFTATNVYMTIETSHFIEQTRYDNTSELIDYLIIELYYYNILQDRMNIQINHYSEELVIPGYVGLFMGGIAFFAGLFLCYIIVRYILVKLI
jgi:hypothetical protein